MQYLSSDIQGWATSPRGAGFLFGGNIMDEVSVLQGVLRIFYRVMLLILATCGFRHCSSEG